MTIDTGDNSREVALYNHAHRMIACCGVRFDAERLRLPPAPMPDSIAIYDSDLLMRRLGKEDGFVGDPAEMSSDEDAAQARQIRLWRRMAQDPRGPWRRLVMPDAGMIERLRGLNAICPQFAEVTARIVRAARLAMVTGTPLRLDPCVVVGPPGVGKTLYAGRLAEALDTVSEFIAMNLMSDRGSTFTGLSPVWKASGPDEIAKLLLDHDHAAPLVGIDELEKASPINPNETPCKSCIRCWSARTLSASSTSSSIFRSAPTTSSGSPPPTASIPCRTRRAVDRVQCHASSRRDACHPEEHFR